MPNQHEEYMGILEVNHYTTADPLPCVGTQIDAPDITEIALYRASMNMETRAINKEQLLTKLRMTDGQFGQMIARPNFNYGQISTLEYVDGHTIDPVNTDSDLKRQLLKNTLDKAMSPDQQILRFINEMEQLSKESLEKGRLGAVSKKELLKLLSLVDMNLPSNEDFALRCFHEVSSNRVLDAAKSIHRVLSAPPHTNAPLSIQNQSTAADAPRMKPEAFLLVSAGGSTQSELFDDINTHGSVTSLTLKKARAEKSLTLGVERYTEDGVLWDIMMSPQQFTRMLRADQTEIPCTIKVNFVNGSKRTEPVKPEHTANMPIDRNESRVTNADESDFLAQVNLVKANMENNEYRGKKGLRALADDIQRLDGAYRKYVESQSELRQDQLKSILQQHQQKAQSYLEKELKRLPVEQREEAKAMLSGVVRQLRFTPQKNKE